MNKYVRELIEQENKEIIAEMVQICANKTTGNIDMQELRRLISGLRITIHVVTNDESETNAD
jgi:hypothetical protein